jgi:hypothetical protein
MTEVMTTKKPKKQKAAYPFPVELIDQLLAQVENKDAESILGESGLAGQLKKMLAERMFLAELSHHLANEEEGGKNHRNGSSPKKVLTPGGELKLDVPRDRLSSFEPKLVAMLRTARLSHRRRPPRPQVGGGEALRRRTERQAQAVFPAAILTHLNPDEQVWPHVKRKVSRKLDRQGRHETAGHRRVAQHSGTARFGPEFLQAA